MGDAFEATAEAEVDFRGQFLPWGALPLPRMRFRSVAEIEEIQNINDIDIVDERADDETDQDVAADEASLVAADPAAVEAIFKKLHSDHRRRLYRFVVKHVGATPDAEDITQQAFVEAVQSYGSFRGGAELSTWLYGIALNIIRNYLSRSPSRKYTFEAESVLESTLDVMPTPPEQLELSKTMSKLDAEIRKLPSHMREVLLMVGLDDASYEEVAHALAIPVGTVRSRLSRARETLRKRLHTVHGEAVF